MNLRRLSSSGAWTDVAAFLLLALALSVPSGFAPGAVLLLLLGLARWPGVLTGRIRWSRPMALWAGSVLVMGLVWSMHITDANGRLVTSTLGLDRCLKYLLVLLLIPALLAQPPHAGALRWGSALGAVGAGLTALWQLQVQHLDRAQGFTNAIQFGNLALLLGLQAGIWALHTRVPRERAVGALGAACGLLASVASGSRGGWITLPLLLLLGLWLSRPVHDGPPPAHRGWRALLVTVGVCVLLALLPGVQKRAEKAADEYQRQEQRQDDSSIGLRLAFWRQAWADGLAQPWVGVGQSGYERRQRAAVDRGDMPPQAVLFNHAHNEWLDMFAKRGLLGVAGLLLFYAVPGLLFWRRLRSGADGLAPPDAPACHAAALCGLITVLGLAGFGMTQVMFAHNNGNMMYLLCVSLYLSVCTPRPARASAGVTA